MGWSLRVLRHRAAAQRTLLATVLAVALVGASLLGTFALLLFSSENRAMDAALTRAPAAATDIDIDLRLERGSPLGATEAGEAFLDELLGGIPSTRAQWLTSPLYRLLSEGDTVGSPMAYLAVNPEIPDHATLAAGAWPGPGADESRVEVAVPKVAADRYGWTVGTELPLRNLTTYEQSTVAVVVGIHELGKPRSLWTRDLLQGAQHDPRYPVPGSFGFVATDAWGPFVVAPEALTATGSVATARLVASPQLADSPPGAVEAVRERLDDAQATLVADTEFDVVTAQFRSRLAATIDVAQGNLAVTRVSLVIVGLMLVVLAVTVLLLAARLLADRRAPEQTLMSSRGASGRQLLGLAALEAAGVALVTTLVSPWLAVLLFQAITSVGLLAEAGLHHDPGRPASLWITCVVSSFVLAGVLLGPLLRRRGSVVDAEQQLVRQDRRGGLARSGADLALVVLAALAVWQLRSYRSPVVEAGSGRLDPVLVAAPALLLLAGAVLALRLLPLVARAGERLATRSRSLIAPLAAWEVGRRPGRAAGAVLLLTLALAVGSFSQSFLDTWRTSQGDQVDLAVGTDVRLDRVDGSGIAQATAVDALADVQALSPVTFRSVTMGHPADAPGESRGRSVDLLAIDTTQAAELLRGRISPPWETITAPLRPAEPATGIALPGAPTGLLLDVETSLSPAVGGVLLVSVVVEDPLGTRTPVELEPLPLVGVSDDIAVALPATSPGLKLVGIVAQILTDPDEDPADLFGQGMADVRLDVGVRELRVVERAAGATEDTVTPVAITAAPWTVQGALQENNNRPLMSVRTDGGVLLVSGGIDPLEVLFGRSGFAAATFAAPGPIPVVVTDTLVAALGVEKGDELQLDLDGVRVPVVVEREVAYLPGLPKGSAVLVDRDLLTRAALLGSSTSALLDEWWLQVPDASAPGLAEHVRHEDLGVAVDRVTAREVAIDGPLRVGVQAALWIVTVAAVALAVAGFAMSATVAVRTRRLELARLQALGTARSGLVRSVLVEHGILGVLGLLAGLALGAVLGQVVAPLVTVSAEGGRPVPSVVVQWPWPTQATLVVVLVVLVGGAVALTTSSLLRRASGELLRLGDER
ncbi:FtsX-like permease family protein [Cellulomonas sp.]|uniref:FtsX-like permease family protein n=1 Tax=Cellulomonas sp. TaxID=40001 RepID=UPI003BAD017D